jgi:hypothetical protein
MWDAHCDERTGMSMSESKLHCDERSVSKSWCRAPYLLLFDNYGLVFVRRPL